MCSQQQGEVFVVPCRYEEKQSLIPVDLTEELPASGRHV